MALGTREDRENDGRQVYIQHAHMTQNNRPDGTDLEGRVALRLLGVGVGQVHLRFVLFDFFGGPWCACACVLFFFVVTCVWRAWAMTNKLSQKHTRDPFIDLGRVLERPDAQLRQDFLHRGLALVHLRFCGGWMGVVCLGLSCWRW